MNLQFAFSELIKTEQFKEIVGEKKGQINQLLFDSRTIRAVENCAFIALKGEFRDGHDFIEDAYKKGIRIFISEKDPSHLRKKATFIIVRNTLKFLQEIAALHRQKFSVPVIAIAGSIGKTTLKEWLYHLLKKEFHVTRSPKSYNSQIGVALSLLEINETTEIALIEAGISKGGEMKTLEKMIRPSIGACTNLFLKKGQEFDTMQELIMETLILFNSCKKVFLGSSCKELLSKDVLSKVVHPSSFVEQSLFKFIPNFDSARIETAQLALNIAHEYTEIKSNQVASLPFLANRLETFEGKNNTLLINDCYNLDIEALHISYNYLRAIGKNRRKIVVFGATENDQGKEELLQSISRHSDLEYVFWEEVKSAPIHLENAVILIKGYNTPDLQDWMNQKKIKKHKTYLSYNLSNIRKNLAEFKRYLPSQTQILSMVKAQSYGSGLEKMGPFLQSCGVDMLGVAYTDEGVELRNFGVEIPILVLNAENHTLSDCIEYNLTPSIYDNEQLDALIAELIYKKKQRFGIHIKLETGMNRLGFNKEELKELIEMVQAQPEIQIEGVFSHLAHADNTNDLSYSIHQVAQFNSMVKILEDKLYKIPIKHILNSEGIVNLSSASYNMVRLGIGMYGITKNKELSKHLLPAIEWTSEISQIKWVKKGQHIGYSKAFQAEIDMKIAIIPVGYADGFRRILGNGKGGVFIRGHYCNTVGNVCMDMIMVDISSLEITSKGDKVEIIGKQQSIEDFALKMNTIPYEVLTSFSKRVPRVYIED